MIIILILFFCLVIGMCASIAVSCWGKIKDRRQRELEYKLNVQRSRDSSIEQGLNRALTTTCLNSSMDCEYPSQMRSSDGASLGRSYMIKSSTNLVDPSSQEEEENGCYVPETNMAFYRKQPNGSLSMQEKYSPDVAHHHNCAIDQHMENDCRNYSTGLADNHCYLEPNGYLTALINPPTISYLSSHVYPYPVDASGLNYVVEKEKVSSLENDENLPGLHQEGKTGTIQIDSCSIDEPQGFVGTGSTPDVIVLP